jgi:outer membrane biosynthesis protein TonB
VGFDVDTEGFPQNVEILEGTEDPYWSKLAVEHVNRFIFRPKLEDGEASTTEGLRWSFNYRANGGEIAD